MLLEIYSRLTARALLDYERITSKRLFQESLTSDMPVALAASIQVTARILVRVSQWASEVWAYPSDAIFIGRPCQEQMACARLHAKEWAVPLLCGACCYDAQAPAYGDLSRVLDLHDVRLSS